VISWHSSAEVCLGAVDVQSMTVRSSRIREMVPGISLELALAFDLLERAREPPKIKFGLFVAPAVAGEAEDFVDALRGRALDADGYVVQRRLRAMTSAAVRGSNESSAAAKACCNSAFSRSKASCSTRSLSRRIRSRMYSLTFS